MGMDAQGFVLLMARLQSYFRCISYDLPDGVADGAALNRYRHADLVADLFAVLDHLSVDRCVLLGASFGSTISLAALHARPQRFTHGILQGGFARRPLAPLEVLAASFARFAPGRLARLPLVRPVLQYNAGAEFQGREPEVWDFFVQQNLQIPVRALAGRALMIHQTDLRPILPAIRQPVLLVCGDYDRLVGKCCEEELQRGLPNVARAEIEQCGHMPQLTHPEVFAEAVQLFLARTAE